MKTFLYMVILGISGVLVYGTGLSLVTSAGGVDHDVTIPVQTGEEHHDDKKGDEESDDQLPPPVYDSDMVIQPDAPPDPDAVVEPPPVDPEMAVDPITREPKSKEELEDPLEHPEESK